jgi:Holliday junction resolvase RusA-like endonuclease
MPKRKMKLVVTLPRYPTKRTGTGIGKPGMAWRRAVYEEIRRAAEESDVAPYPPRAQIECTVRLALDRNRLDLQDVDNLLKHVFDAMQGRLGGPKAEPRGWHLLPNDYQIRRVTVEKVEAPERKWGSRLLLTKYVARRRLRAKIAL